jgi:uncharacterized protein YndB with AHSA1/START domain
MNAQSIPPVVKTMRVEAPIARAFDVFTGGIDRWWPHNGSFGKTPLRNVSINPGIGGRWVETDADGVERVIATVTHWDPPRRVVMTWFAGVNALLEDKRNASELEVRFNADGPNATEIELTHHKFGVVDAVEGAKIRAAVERGWPMLLKLFADEAERAA